MEHHEFLDGSGYPRNLSQESISPLGRILSLAELFTAIHSPERNASEHRLWVLLRMNQHRYDPLLVERLLERLEPDRSSLEEDMFRLPDPVQWPSGYAAQEPAKSRKSKLQSERLLWSSGSRHECQVLKTAAVSSGHFEVRRERLLTGIELGNP